MKERNAFVIVIGGDEGVGKTLIKCMLQKNPGTPDDKSCNSETQ